MTAANSSRLQVQQLTPSGRGAVATIRIEGDLSTLAAMESKLFRSASGWNLSELPINRLCFGQWGRDVTEDIVACRINDTSIELHCHGGQSAVQRLLDDLCTQALAGVESEISQVLQRTTTLRTAGWVLSQSGRLQSSLELIETLIATGDRLTAKQMIDRILSWTEFGRHLTEPWSVAVIGRPNVGKSSLINRLVGFERSIVFDEPGTTRDVVMAETVLDGWPVRLSDTAGQHDSAIGLEADGIARALVASESADLRIIVLDQSQPRKPRDFQLLAEWPEAIIVINKSDLPAAWSADEMPRAMRVSCETTIGIEALSTEIIRQLVPQLPDNSDTIPLTQQQITVLHQICDAILSQHGQR